MIIRSKHDKRNPYLTISMKILRDRRLSSEERDCLIMMLSNSDNWEFSYTGLASQLGIRRETVKLRVQGLIEKGYVSVSYPIDENGKPLPFAKGTWEIREEPITSAGFTGTRKPAHTCLISRHEDSGTREQALESRHEDSGTKDPAQRTTEGIKSGLSNAKHQEKDDQGMRMRTTTTPTSPSTTAEQNPEERVVVVADFSPSPNKGELSGENSSGAKAPSLGDKNTGGEQVVSPLEFKFQEFLKKYPKAPLSRELEETRKAFFDAIALDGNFEMIMAGLDEWCDSPEWTRDEGRWIKKPLNFIKERQWEKRSRPKSFLEQMQEVLPDEEDDFFNGIN